MEREKLICVGAVMGAFGVKGEVRVKSFCAAPEDLDQYGALFSEDGARQYDLRLTRAVKAGFAARIAGIRTKDQADALRGTRLFVPRDALPNLPNDEYYYSDLIGLLVLDTGGAQLGKVTSVQDHGAGDLIEVKGKGLPASGVLVPFTRDAVPTVDLGAGRLVVDPPEGLFPTPEPEAEPSS